MCWTVRTGPIEAVLKDYSIFMETIEEINHTTHDEYGLKAGGILSLLEIIIVLNYKYWKMRRVWLILSYKFSRFSIYNLICHIYVQ